MDNSNLVPNEHIEWPVGYGPKGSQVFAQNTVDINAPPEVVWSLLIDCLKWPDWYKHCSDVSILKGRQVLERGSQFRFKTIGYFFEPTIDVFEPSRMLCWSAQGVLGTQGAHAWLIERTPTGCHVVTEEAQNGFLLRLIGGRVKINLLECHEEWLRALKVLAEEKSSQS